MASHSEENDVCITEQGYRAVYVTDRKKGEKSFVLEHRLVWEEANGPIPEGHVIHHINCDKTDNRIENLALLTQSDHMRIHSGWVKREDGGWVKLCSLCGEMKDVETEFYKTNDKTRKDKRVVGICKECSRKKAVSAYRENPEASRQRSRNRILSGEEKERYNEARRRKAANRTEEEKKMISAARAEKYREKRRARTASSRAMKEGLPQ